MTDYLKCNIDFHLHGLYSRAVSQQMVPNMIAEQAPLKGLDVVATSDILHSKWISMVKDSLKENSQGLLEHSNGTKFIMQTEIEDNNRVHHVILVPSLSKAEEIREAFSKKCKNLDSDGRPKIWLNGEEIAEVCVNAESLIGPAHAFTPYFGIYKKYDSYKDCYGRYANKIYFLELGLSADTNMADRIEELHNLTFMSNSDAHSPWPNKLGREFNIVQLKEISFDEIKKAIKRENGRKFIGNIGFNPLEGKYHKTRCIGCLTFFEPLNASKLNWKCPNCSKSIKKGADFRVEELSSFPLGTHPEHRPPYTYIIPLSEIIALGMKISNTWSMKVQEEWKKFVDAFGSEIKVLLETEISELEKINPMVADYVQHFRDGKIKYVPGGAGVYGKLVPPDEKIPEQKTFDSVQKSLGDY